MITLPWHLEQDFQSLSTEELEATEDLYDRLVDGTLYSPGTKFMPSPTDICFDCWKKAEFLLREDVALCVHHAMEEAENDLW
jgi:hypothetical protein